MARAAQKPILPLHPPHSRPRPRDPGTAKRAPPLPKPRKKNGETQNGEISPADPPNGEISPADPQNGEIQTARPKTARSAPPASKRRIKPGESSPVRIKS
jgi:hypothetical protein